MRTCFSICAKDLRSESPRVRHHNPTPMRPPRRLDALSRETRFVQPYHHHRSATLTAWRLRRQWFAEPRRETHVGVADLPKFYAAIRKLKNDVGRDYLTLLLFTGLRRSEAATLTWGDVDLVGRTPRIPAARAKSGRTLVLPLSKPVHDMLTARRAPGKTAFVFPSSSRSGHVEEPKSFLAAVARESGMRVSAHDIRRTFASIAASLGDVLWRTVKSGADFCLGIIDFFLPGIAARSFLTEGNRNRIPTACNIAGRNIKYAWRTTIRPV